MAVKITVRACKLSRKRVPAGELVFALTNKSKVVHSLAVAGKQSRKVKPRHWSWDTTEFGAGELPLWEGTALGALIDQGLGHACGPIRAPQSRAPGTSRSGSPRAPRPRRRARRLPASSTA